MNSLWLANLFKYKNTDKALQTSRQIVQVKIYREVTLAKKYKNGLIATNLSNTKSISDIFLLEARSARSFWKFVKSSLKAEYNFNNRKAHNTGRS